jgi:hypothetical protein
VGKKYGCSKGYPQRNAAHMGNIMLNNAYHKSVTEMQLVWKRVDRNNLVTFAK